MSIAALSRIGTRYSKPVYAGAKAHVLKPGEDTSLCGATNLGKVTRKKPEQRHVCFRCARSAKIEWENSGDLDFHEAMLDFTVPCWLITLPDGFVATRTTVEQIAKDKYPKMKAKFGDKTELTEVRAVVTPEGTITVV